LATGLPEKLNNGTSKFGSSSAAVLNVLEDRIASGDYAAGSWLPTEREIAQELGVNRSAVRDALMKLANDGRIIREPGCRPRVRGTGSQQRTDTKSTDRTHITVAVVLPQHDSDLASREILRGVSRTFRGQEISYRTLIFDTNQESKSWEDAEDEACTAVENEDIAGAIVWSVLDPDILARWHRLAQNGRPIVFVDRFDNATPSDFVGVDNVTAARDAVEYLISLGHTRIAHITSDEDASVIQQRSAGYKLAMEDAGLQAMERVWVLPDDGSDDSESFDRILDSGALPTAVFALNDWTARAFVNHLNERGISVPDKISVIGFDDIERYAQRPAHLTTMRQPFDRIGQRAAELLVQRLTTPNGLIRRYQHVCLSTQLIQRSTCRTV